MSLEHTIAENTAALRDLIAISTRLHDLRADAIEKVGAAAATKAAKESKSAKQQDAGGAKPNISTSPENRVDPNDTGTDGIKDLIASYITATDRAEERDARKAKVRALLNHEKIRKSDIETASAVEHIKPESVALFKDQMKKLIDKGDLTTPPKDDDLDL